MDRTKPERQFVDALIGRGITIEDLAALTATRNTRALNAVAALILAQLRPLSDPLTQIETIDEFSTRTRKALVYADVKLLGVLQALTTHDLRARGEGGRQIGPKTLKEIKEFLASLGLRLRDPHEKYEDRLKAVFSDPRQIPLICMGLAFETRYALLRVGYDTYGAVARLPGDFFYSAEQAEVKRKLQAVGLDFVPE